MEADARKRIVLAMQRPHVAFIEWQADLLGSTILDVVVLKRKDMNVPVLLLPWAGSALQERLCTGLPRMQDAMMKAMRNVPSAAVAMRSGRRCWEKRMELVREYAVAMQACRSWSDFQSLTRFFFSSHEDKEKQKGGKGKKRKLTTTSVPTIADGTATFSCTMPLTRLPARPMTERRDTSCRSLRAMKTAPGTPNPGS